MDNDWKKRLGVVYSTSDDYAFDYGKEKEVSTPAPGEQKLIVSLDKRHRKGKAVTLVSGFRGSDDDRNALGKALKVKCGVGGSVKGEDILLQGDHRDQVVSILHNEGYQVKRSGG